LLLRELCLCQPCLLFSRRWSMSWRRRAKPF
jgi:hypothetical protein